MAMLWAPRHRLRRQFRIERVECFVHRNGFRGETKPEHVVAGGHHFNACAADVRVNHSGRYVDRVAFGQNSLPHQHGHKHSGIARVVSGDGLQRIHARGIQPGGAGCRGDLGRELAELGRINFQ